MVIERKKNASNCPNHTQCGHLKERFLLTPPPFPKLELQSTQAEDRSLGNSLTRVGSGVSAAAITAWKLGFPAHK